MIRVLNPEPLIELASNPSTRPWLGGTEDIAPIITAAVENVANYSFLAGDAGGYLYICKAQGLYEVHTIGTPDGGRDFVRTMAKARTDTLRFMFLETDAHEIVTIVPKPNIAAMNWATHAGFRVDFLREKAFDLMGDMVDAFYLSLPYGNWVLTDPANRREGERFHAFIHQYTPDDHGDDEVHDSWVGATLDGAQRGNAVKCITLYNRWAVRAGYEPLRVLTMNPLCIDIGSAIVQITADGLDCLHVRSPEGLQMPAQDLPGEPACPSPPSKQLQA